MRIEIRIGARIRLISLILSIGVYTPLFYLGNYTLWRIRSKNVRIRPLQSVFQTINGSDAIRIQCVVLIFVVVSKAVAFCWLIA